MRERKKVRQKKKEKERCVAWCSSLGHLACLSSFPLEDFAMLTLKMDGWREGEGEQEQLRALGQQSDSRKDTTEASQDFDLHVYTKKVNRERRRKCF